MNKYVFVDMESVAGFTPRMLPTSMWQSHIHIITCKSMEDRAAEKMRQLGNLGAKCWLHAWPNRGTDGICMALSCVVGKFLAGMNEGKTVGAYIVSERKAFDGLCHFLPFERNKGARLFIQRVGKSEAMGLFDKGRAEFSMKVQGMLDRLSLSKDELDAKWLIGQLHAQPKTEDALHRHLEHMLEQKLSSDLAPEFLAYSPRFKALYRGLFEFQAVKKSEDGKLLYGQYVIF